MSVRIFYFSVASLTFSAVLAVGAMPTSSAGQKQFSNKSNTTNPMISGDFKALLAGRKPNAAADKKVLENAGNYYVHRVTWELSPKYDDDDGMGGVQKAFKNLMNDKGTVTGANKEFMSMLAPVLVDRLNDVLELDFKTQTAAVTNAALMLPVLARCKQNVVHDYLLKLAKEDPAGKPGKAFIRMCAIKGLGELNNPHGLQLEDASNAADLAAKRLREQARLDVIWAFIQQPYPPEGESEAHQEAFSFVRREGVKALAQMRLPAYKVAKNQVTGPVAYYLLYIASGSPPSVGPPYTLSEKLEAAIGLCLLDAKETPQYKSDLAAHLVANVLADTARAYANDYKFFSIKPDPKKRDDPLRQSLLPWKAYGYRLEEGLKTLQNNMNNNATANVLKSKVIMTTVDKMKNGNAMEPPEELRTIAASLRPASGEIYQGCKEPALPLVEK